MSSEFSIENINAKKVEKYTKNVYVIYLMVTLAVNFLLISTSLRITPIFFHRPLQTQTDSANRGIVITANQR